LPLQGNVRDVEDYALLIPKKIIDKKMGVVSF